jgi:hypothetical protein
MGERLKADLGVIGQAATQIRRIGTEFEQATTLASGYAPALGSGQLASTLDAFANGWSIHRQRLIDDMHKEADLAGTAVKAYHGTDAQLAAALRKAGKDGA